MTDLNAPENGLGLRRIKVRGVGRDVRPPDLAVVSVGVETRAVAAGAANNTAAATKPSS